MSIARRVAGLAAILFAIGFNIPYAILAATFDYPDILRRPAGEVLTQFAEAGPGLILTWHGFALAALALAPVAMGLALSQQRVRQEPGLAITAAVFGAMAALTQAMGLWRWVFVVPALAALYTDPLADAGSRAAAEHSFAILNLYGGVAIGEHLGQWLTALFVATLAVVQAREARPLTAGLGAMASLAVMVGTTEGLAIALGGSGAMFAMFTIAGFLLVTVWLIVTGGQEAFGRRADT